MLSPLSPSPLSPSPLSPSPLSLGQQSLGPLTLGPLSLSPLSIAFTSIISHGSNGLQRNETQAIVHHWLKARIYGEGLAVQE